MEDDHVWIELRKVTLTQVALINRRRGGEAERMFVAAYIEAQQNKCTHLDDTLSVMNQDKTAAVLRNDQLIMKFGSTLYLKRGHSCHRWPYIRQCFRQIGRLLTEITKRDPSVRSLTH